MGKEYKISYENASGWASERNIKVKIIESKYLKAYDSHTHEQRTFRKDRIKKSVEI